MTDTWRYRCPRGHTSWVSRDSDTNPSMGEYYCGTCARNYDDGPFDELVDMKDPADHHVADPEVSAV